MKRQLLAWISILVFFISTNGIVIYKHICLSSDTNSISLSQLLCETEVQEEESCCSGTNNHDDCCDVDLSFEKYTPSGKSELQKLSYQIVWESFPDQPIAFNNSIQQQYFEILSVFPNSPNPYIHQPKTVSERLADIQSYLC